MKRERLSFGRKLTIAIETLKALTYLHSQNPPILHRDLKTANLLVDENYHIKVADFGLSKPAEETKGSEDETVVNEGGGTLYCMAPEAFRQNYVKESDVYSFGIILYELFTETVPYEGMSQMQIIRSIEEEKPLPLPDDIDEDIAEIIKACLNHDVKKRPSLSYMSDKVKAVKMKYLKMSEGIESSY